MFLLRVVLTSSTCSTFLLVGGDEKNLEDQQSKKGGVYGCFQK